MFRYYNSNPNGYHIPDCVVRAITTATGLNYYDVVCMLKTNGTLFQCDELNVRCYEKLLDCDLKFPHYKGDNYYMYEIAEDFPNDILILRTEGHLSLSIRGVIHDIWDCSRECVTDFWIVE